ADTRHLGAQTLHGLCVRVVLVPFREVLADPLESTLIALVERIGNGLELADDLCRSLLDPRSILRRQLDEQRYVLRAPLQPRRGTLRCRVRLLGPVDGAGLVAALLG